MKFSLIYVLSAFLLVGCAKNISSDAYTEADSGTVKQSYKGIVVSKRAVQVNHADKFEDNKLGLIGGGVTGALLGSQVGAGRGQVVGTALGAIAGAVGGGFLEQKMKSQAGMEYSVQLSSGRILTVVQSPEPRLEIGQHVLVLVGGKGRSRIVADQMAAQQQHAYQTNAHTFSQSQPSKKKIKKSRGLKKVERSSRENSSTDYTYKGHDQYGRDQGLYRSQEVIVY